MPIEIIGFKDISESLKDIFLPEYYFNENKVLCEYYKKKFNAKKYIFFENYPRYFVIILKHFKFNKELNIIQKINDYIEYPQELNLNNINNINKNDTDNNYELISVVFHSGNHKNGQYIH